MRAPPSTPPSRRRPPPAPAPPPPPPPPSADLTGQPAPSAPLEPGDPPESPGLRPPPRHWRGAWQLWTDASDSLSAEGRARLLAMVGLQVSPEIAGLVIPPVLIWMFGREHDVRPLFAWAAVYWALCAVAILARQRLRLELTEGPAQRVDSVWQPRVCAMAAAYGATWGALPWATMAAGAHEFATLVYLVLSAVLASTAVLAAPLHRAFLCFFAGCWGGGTVALYGMFPLHWPWVMALQVLYGAIILRHSAATHRFMVEQVGLEERSAELARSYQAARDQAQAALRARSELLARASHDLRQPVNALAMIADVLARRSTDPDAAPVLKDLTTCVHTLNLMFESLMDLSQLQSGALQARLQDCSLAALLAEVDAQFRGVAAARSLSWRCRLPAQGAWVRADPVLLRRSVFNLIHNALRYTRRGGVLVAARRRGSQWRIEVRDTGLGVAEEDRDSIYAPFYRHADASRMDSTGHGLGLAVFAECATLMGAGSGLASQPGKGSCFWLSLEAVGGLPARLHGRCLVVDGDAHLAARWATWFAGWGVEGRFASSAAQARRYVDEGFQPDAVLCGEAVTLEAPGARPPSDPAPDTAATGEPLGFALLLAMLSRCPSAVGALLCSDPRLPDALAAEEQGYLVLQRPVAPEMLLALFTQWWTTPAPRGDGHDPALRPDHRPAPGHGAAAPHAAA